MKKVLMMGLLLGLSGVAQGEDVTETVLTYSISVYQGNTLVWAEDIQAGVDHVTDVTVAPDEHNGVGLVGYIWPQSTPDGVNTKFVLDADWAKGATDEPEVTLRAEDAINLEQATAENLNQNTQVEPFC